MVYKVTVRPLAIAELQEAYRWYNQQQVGLGETFIIAIEDYIKKISNHPNTFSYYQKPIRQASLKKFPYTIVYEVNGNDVIIFSIFMYKQNPLKKRTK